MQVERRYQVGMIRDLASRFSAGDSSARRRGIVLLFCRRSGAELANCGKKLYSQADQRLFARGKGERTTRESG